jgi:endogenous inhibitor of DNA gyrase (YacG/DUF329 family)
MPSTRLVTCPTCGKSVTWTPANAWRPFCSGRCKLIDLGAWATERYRVPVVEDKDQPETEDPNVSGSGAGPTATR